MRSNALPSEFEDLLNGNGRRVLAGTHALCGALADPRTRFLARGDLVGPAEGSAAAARPGGIAGRQLEPIERPIPPESIFGMRHDYARAAAQDQRARAPSTSRAGASPASKNAERIGLVRLMRSASFRAFAEALAGRALAAGWGLQVAALRPGRLRRSAQRPPSRESRTRAAGYVDLHLSLCSPGVAHQWLVYSRARPFQRDRLRGGAGHRSTAYRLPFWHYTTPLVAKRGTPAIPIAGCCSGPSSTGLPRAPAARR